MTAVYEVFVKDPGRDDNPGFGSLGIFSSIEKAKEAAEPWRRNRKWRQYRNGEWFVGKHFNHSIYIWTRTIDRPHQWNG